LRICRILTALSSQTGSSFSQGRCGPCHRSRTLTCARPHLICH